VSSSRSIPVDDDDIFLYSYPHAGMPTNWFFSDAQAKKLREYFLRGGFLTCDSFFGTQEWAGFERGIRQIFPDREIVDLPDDDQIFHTAYDLKEKYQAGNFRSLIRNGNPYRDDHGRVMVMINFNNDLGDSWRLADDPQYPQTYSYMAIRLGLNYLVYTMTH
jgi:hypothetical protein